MKKRFLISFITPLLLACANDVPIPSIELKDDGLNFLIASDIHYMDSSLLDDSARIENIDIAGDGQATYYSSVITDAFIEKVISIKPDALLLTGDNTFNGEKASHDSLIEKLKSIQKEEIPVYVLPGNHDVGIYRPVEYKNFQTSLVPSYKKDDYKRLYARFGYSQAEYQDPNSFSYIKEIGKNVFGIMLDTNVSSTYYVKEETFPWLESSLKELKEKGATIFSFSHQTLEVHSPTLTEGFRISNADDVLSLYKEYGVKANFAGHMHIQHSINDEGFMEILTSALSINPCQYGLLSLNNNKWNYHTEKLDVTSFAKKKGYVDEHLADFSSFISKLFDDSNSWNLARSIYFDESLNENERDEFVNTVEILNKAFFEGMPLTFTEQLNNKVGNLIQYLNKQENPNQYLLDVIEELKLGINHTNIDL